MAERKLPMGAKEIVASYRTAKNPKAQIGVLADLNGCTEKEIEEILMQLGAIKPAERKKAQSTEDPCGRRGGAGAAGAGYDR